MKTSHTKLLPLTLLLFTTVAEMPASAFYNPNTGRWLNRDPIAEKGGRNLWGFSRNDLNNRLDALGLRGRPQAFVDRCADPCAGVPEEERAVGGVVCCKGKTYICIWKTGGNTGATNPTARSIIDECVRQHENDHLKYPFYCPGICNFGWGWPTIAKSRGNPFAEHCQIYSEEVNCLQGGTGRCGEDADCAGQLQQEINAVIRERDLNCAAAR